MLKTVKIPEQFKPVFEKAQEYVRRYFEAKKEDPSKGTIEIFGERYILVRAASLSVEFFETVMKLYEREGKEEALNIARQLLFDIAHAIGMHDAKTFHKKMNLKDPIEKLSAGPIHFSYSGWAFVDIFPESRPSPDENYYLIYDHPYSFESAAWLRSGKKSDFPVCIMNAGYSSGWCEESFGITLVASEIMCQAKGDHACRFIMAPPSRIEEHIAGYIRKEPRLAEKITGYEIPGFFKRKEIEAELRDSEQRFRAIFDNAMVGMLLIDLQNNKFSDGNKMICQMLGYGLEEIKSLGVMDIYPEMVQAHIAEELEKLTREEITPVEDLPMKRKDGTVFYAVVNFSTVTLSGKNYLIGLFRDITKRRQAEELAERLNHQNELILKAAGEGIFGLDIHGKHKFMNPSAAQMLGYTVDELIGINSHSACHYKKADGRPYPEEDCPIHAAYKDGKIHHVTDEVFWRKDGTSFPVEYTSTPIREDGKISGAVVTFRDITKRRQAEKALLDSEAYLKTLMASIQAGVMVIDVEKHRIVDINEAAAKLIGTPKEKIIGKECHEYICPAERGKCPILDLKQTIDNAERSLINARCEKIPILKTAVPITIRKRKYLLESFIDISDRKRMEEELKRLAITDSLTQAYNRAKFQEVIKREMERTKRHGSPLSIAMFDIDRFKEVNDTYGHNTGDYVLKTLTQIAKMNMRDIDYLIRWGGEEFIVIALDTDLRGVEVLSEKIRKAIENYEFENVKHITVSFGVTQFKQDDTEDSFIKRVDDALYQAKEKGRNRVEVVA